MSEQYQLVGDQLVVVSTEQKEIRESYSKESLLRTIGACQATIESAQGEKKKYEALLVELEKLLAEKPKEEPLPEPVEPVVEPVIEPVVEPAIEPEA